MGRTRKRGPRGNKTWFAKKKIYCANYRDLDRRHRRKKREGDRKGQ